MTSVAAALAQQLSTSNTGWAKKTNKQSDIPIIKNIDRND